MGNKHFKKCQELNFNIVSTYEPKRNDNYQNYLDSLEMVDGVIIANPTNFHLQTIIDIKIKYPHIKILCEKPIAHQANDNLLKEILPYSNTILIGQIERFNPVYQKINNIIINNNILQIKTIRVSDTPAREIIDCRKDIGIHDLDLCTGIMKKLPSHLDIYSTHNFSHELLTYQINNTIISNEISWNYPFRMRKLYILTTNRLLYIADLYKQTLYLKTTNNINNIAIKNEDCLKLELLHFKDMICNNIAPINTIEHNISLLKLMKYY